MELTEDIVKDAFTHLLDEDWSFILAESYRISTFGGNIGERFTEKGSTPTKAIKNFLEGGYAIDSYVKCFKVFNIYLKKNNRNLIKFKEFKSSNNSLIGGLSSLCDDLGVNEEDVGVNTSFGDYNIEIKLEMFKVKNLLKFVTIQKSFNKSWSGIASIGLYANGIILNIKYNQLPSENSEIMQTLLENFTIEEKENSLYLQPKFEFIVYDK